MHLHRIEFHPHDGRLPERLPDAVHELLGALSQNGQICGRDNPTVIRNDCFVTQVLAPERVSFEPVYHSEPVLGCLEICASQGLAVRFVAEARKCDSEAPCSCREPAAYVLYTHFLSNEPPVRCLDCFHPLPLYRLLGLKHAERAELVRWMRAYQHCDSLQMGVAVLERPAGREMSSEKSELSALGLDLCSRLSGISGRPFYYYLYRDTQGSRRSEERRLCPVCHQAWRLDVCLHERFDFRCDACRLLSNVSWRIARS